MKFSGCMRSHGVSDFPDPTIGSNGLPSWASSTTRPPPAYNAARLVCKARAAQHRAANVRRKSDGQWRGAQVRHVHAVNRRAQLP